MNSEIAEYIADNCSYEELKITVIRVSTTKTACVLATRTCKTSHIPLLVCQTQYHEPSSWVLISSSICDDYKICCWCRMNISYSTDINKFFVYTGKIYENRQFLICNICHKATTNDYNFIFKNGLNIVHHKNNSLIYVNRNDKPREFLEINYRLVITNRLNFIRVNNRCNSGNKCTYCYGMPNIGISYTGAAINTYVCEKCYQFIISRFLFDFPYKRLETINGATVTTYKIPSNGLKLTLCLDVIMKFTELADVKHYVALKLLDCHIFNAKIIK